MKNNSISESRESLPESESCAEPLRQENEIKDVMVTDKDISESHSYHAVYGVGLNLKIMKLRCPYAELVGVGKLKDYELQFHGPQNLAHLTAAPKPGTVVPVAIWKVPKAEEQKFLQANGYSMWKSKSFDVQLDNKYGAKANCYFDDYEYPFAMPTKGYYWDIYQGYLDHGFDVNILNNALRDSTVKCYAKAYGLSIEQVLPYKSEEEDLEDTGIGALIMGG